MQSLVRGAGEPTPAVEASSAAGGVRDVQRDTPVDFGSLRRLTPISREWGMDRGQAIDRFYIEQFLEANAPAIRGRVLEVAGADYTRRFGRGVTVSDVLNVVDGDPGTTIVADLSQGETIPSDCFDCIICTQTLQLIYDVRAAARTLHRTLKPGGVLLATIPGISQISRVDMDRWGDYWRFTRASAQRLFGDAFATGEVQVETRGNVRAAVAFLYGIAAEELSPEELAHPDPDCELLIAVRATKGLAPGS
jgi:SAM-dependent methyltransferase